MDIQSRINKERRRLFLIATFVVFLHAYALAIGTHPLWLGGQKNTVLTVTFMDSGNGALPSISVLQKSISYKHAKSYKRHSKQTQKNKLSKINAITINHADYHTQSFRNISKSIQNTFLQEKEQTSTDSTLTASNELIESQLVKSKIQSAIYSQLARYFTYPMIARQRGWEGRVLLDFNILPTGKISTIRVVHSSGHAILDHSAVYSLSRVKRITSVSQLLEGNILAMQLPVIFRLRND